ncbi:MAG: sigma-70 family RNA polymerase sigma factor [Phycisphaerae bacterium]|nr:sigma-70 family RNA polymerase sigma factor [Phycisphaerae bacterium]
MFLPASSPYNETSMMGIVDVPDTEVAAAAAGAKDARTRVLGLLAPRVRLMVLARLNPTILQGAAVDDVAEDVLLAVLAGLPRLEVRTLAGLRAFVSGVVTRKVADFIRGRGNGHRPERKVRSLDSTIADLSHAGPVWEFLSASGASPHSAVDQAERIARLMSELARLKDSYRQVITLAFFDQLPLSEIAEQMGLSRPAASMLLIRAVQALRQQVADLNTSGNHNGNQRAD